MLVDDLDEALAYYTRVLGFVKRDDVDMGGDGSLADRLAR
nr:VOC family protein [Halomarina oriensis]